ncbi:hypothetical protein J5N97_017512 [Dioscorea zingiberensis]|uniref:Uncharacterized protein n=1 Tax=Dioscorea zingiberensis TaxID=325984 RepID=A0A9D5CM35_9LILI|nr:hypothetical protein J5N97_017512 [Dioscorea zingiberensis]
MKRDSEKTRGNSFPHPLRASVSRNPSICRRCRRTLARLGSLMVEYIASVHVNNVGILLEGFLDCHGQTLDRLPKIRIRFWPRGGGWIDCSRRGLKRIFGK